MSDKTGIEWSEATWNPVVGCSKVSPGCDNCYAITQAHRIIRMSDARDAKTPYQGTVLDDGSDWTGTVKCLPERLDQPLRWKRPRRVFVNSMSDLFHPDVPDQFIASVFAVMSAARQHQFQILTKRPKRMAQKVTWWGSTWVADPPADPPAGGFRQKPEKADGVNWETIAAIAAIADFDRWDLVEGFDEPAIPQPCHGCGRLVESRVSTGVRWVCWSCAVMLSRRAGEPTPC
jgi:hypothetical protein